MFEWGDGGCLTTGILYKVDTLSQIAERNVQKK